MQYAVNPVRPWRVVAHEVAGETDSKRMLELVEELNTALDNEQSIRERSNEGQSYEPIRPAIQARDRRMERLIQTSLSAILQSAALCRRTRELLKHYESSKER